MSRAVRLQDLVGSAEIAERLGVQRRQVVHEWRHRHADFPEPVAVISRTMIWLWPDIERWAKRSGRLR